MTEHNYEAFLTTLSKEAWQRVGLQRRGGVAVPLFSLHSNRSIGIGDLFDLRLLVDWCNKTSLSIIQLLPMNDVGFNFRPYDGQSTFALDPMYLSLEHLEGIDLKPFGNDIKKLKKDFPAGKISINYAVKSAKLRFLWKIFAESSTSGDPRLEEFIHKNRYWLEDYALFRVIKEINNEMAWEGWSQDLKQRKAETLCAFRETYSQNLLFQKWLQWQLYEQFKSAKQYASEHGVLIMGDLPFLVSRDSADVWQNQGYFKLHLAAGAPPDMLYAKGQRWGMPPYDWAAIEHHRYDYLVEKVKYAENFYDMYRIDHVVGIFRVWTISLSEPLEHSGATGSFDPKHESVWEEHGRKILSCMVKNSRMLACAEDLGVVPACSYKVLDEFGIPGIDIQRWMRDWQKTHDFKDPVQYRKNSLATIATHDMSNLCAWWDFEAGTVDEELFKRKCREKNISFDSIKDVLFDLAASHHGRLRWKKTIAGKEKLVQHLRMEEASCRDMIDLHSGSFDEKEKFLKFLGLEGEPHGIYPRQLVKKALEKISETASIFSVPLIFDWLSLDSLLKIDPWDIRINFPGTLSEKNWTIVLPIPLEDMLKLPINEAIKDINRRTQRGGLL